MSFPASPTTGARHTINGVEYVFTSGGGWRVATSADGPGGQSTNPSATSWTTAGRPVSPAIGRQGLNTTLGYLEYWDGTTWSLTAPPITGLAAIAAIAADDEVAVFDRSISANRKMTLAQISEAVSISDFAHRQMFFFGG